MADTSTHQPRFTRVRKRTIHSTIYRISLVVCGVSTCHKVWAFWTCMSTAAISTTRYRSKNLGRNRTSQALPLWSSRSISPALCRVHRIVQSGNCFSLDSLKTRFIRPKTDWEVFLVKFMPSLTAILLPLRHEGLKVLNHRDSRFDKRLFLSLIGELVYCILYKGKV